MTTRAKGKGNQAKPARGKKGRGRSSAITLPMIVANVLRFFGLFLLLLWRGLCYITPPLPVWQRFAKSRITHRVAALLVCAILCLVTLGIMRGSLAQGDQWKIDPQRIQFTSLDLGWVSGEGETTLRRMIDASLRESLADLEEVSAFETDTVEAVGIRLAKNPWVHSVERIERRFPGTNKPSTLMVTLKLYRPVLRIPLNDRVYLVAKANSQTLAGHVLPWAPVLENQIPKTPQDQVAYASLADTIRTVANVYGDAPTIGKSWGNEQIRAAISMEEELRRHKIDAKFSVSSIDVLDVAREARWDGQVAYTPLGGVRLRGPANGSMPPVIWGKPPVHASSVELPTAAKIEKLTTALAKDPSLAMFQPALPLNQ